MSQLENPFAARPAAPPKAAAPAWGIAASGPPVDASEVEIAQRAAEVVILWGDDVLHVAHVSPPRDIVIGEANADYLMGKDILGVDRLPIVVERNGQLACVLPEGATGSVTIDGTRKTFAELDADGKLAVFDGLAGAKLFPMPEGASARVEHRGLAFLVRPTNAAKTIGATTTFRWKHAGWIGLSLGVHSLMLMLFYFMPPQTSALSLDRESADSRLVEYLLASQETVEPEPVWTQQATDEAAGGSGTPAADESGAAGDEHAEHTNNHMAIRGPRDNVDPQLARENLRDNIENVGAIGTVRSLIGSWNTPTSPYGENQAIGYDEESAIGALMGEQAGSNFGFNGLGMLGHGRGGGGTGLGTMGVGGYRTIGRCCGGNGEHSGYGDGVDVGGPPHREHVPTARPGGDASVLGSLSAEAIRRVVHQHLPEVRYCYEQGLTQNPSLEGRVQVSWVIQGDGRVQGSRVANSSVNNERVESCIAQAVTRWTFPQPTNGGIVGVNYPFVLNTN